MRHRDRQRRKREEDLDRELRSDLALETEEQMQTGLPPEEAWLAAQRNFGDVTVVKEEVRDQRFSVKAYSASPAPTSTNWKPSSMYVCGPLL
jgi:hypothetical protein